MLIKYIIISIIIKLVLNFLFKTKYNTLSCGLFGASADDIKNISMDKLKILGIFNDTRGGHSCGISLDGDVYYGTNKDKLFKDFISTTDILAPDELPIVMGHTRFATGGTHNEENAHPFGFGDNGHYYRFIGAHNGSLKNHLELAKLYDIETSIPAPTSYNKKLTRTKIDSEILLEILKTSGYKVLEQYEGAAALSLYDTTEPNVLYLYHGKSKLYKTSSFATEERPLFYYKTKNNVLYYSSIKESLDAINDDGGLVIELPHNILFRITGSDIENAETIEIDRSKSFQKDEYVYSNNYAFGYNLNNSANTTKNTNKSNNSVKKAVTTAENASLMLIEAKSKREENIRKDEVYYENLRFYKNSELLAGIYVLDANFELKFVCHSFGMKEEIYNTTTLIKKHNIPIFLYFYRGILLKDAADYKIVMPNAANYTADKLSHMSVYPVKSLEYITGIAFYNGQLANMKFSNPFTNNIFNIKNGICTEVIDKMKSKLNIVELYLSEDTKLIETFYKSSNNEENVKTDDHLTLELYKENMITTVDELTEDVDDSFDNLLIQSKIKTKLNSIKEFIINTLNL